MLSLAPDFWTNPQSSGDGLPHWRACEVDDWDFSHSIQSSQAISVYRWLLCGTVTTQCGDEDETCMVYQADDQPQGNCKSVMEARILADNGCEEDVGSHKVGSHHRVYGRTLEDLAAPWKAWSVYDRPMEQAVKWAHVKTNTVVKQVKSGPAANDLLEIYDASLGLMECDSGAPRSFFRTLEFDSCGSKQFGSPWIEPD